VLLLSPESPGPGRVSAFPSAPGSHMCGRCRSLSLFVTQW